LEQSDIYLAALFHDIGKLIERSKVYNNKKVNELFSNIKYSHARYTAFFLKSYLSQKDWITNDNDKLIELSAYHHNPKSPEGRIIQLADWLASSERVEDPENTAIYNTVQLRSIFGTLNKQKIKKYYKLRDLSFNNLLPEEKDEESTRKLYHLLSEKMIEEFKRVKNKKELIFFLEEYLTFVPAQTTKNDPDISLFDHSKLTAAIAVCLYHEINNGSIDDNGIKQVLKLINKEDLDSEHFILINADLSGIQNYIFNIPSKGAAKSLKGRSTYLVLLMEAICDFMITELGLEKANVIYNGGGNFYILAPASMEDKITNLKTNISEILFDAHKGSLICNIGYTKIKLYEFKNFRDVWKRSAEQTAKEKNRKLSAIWNDKYEDLFAPKELINGDKFCNVCHSTDNVEMLEDQRLCSLCYSFEKLTKTLAEAKYQKLSNISKLEEKTYRSILHKFDYNHDFSVSSNSSNDYLLNEFGNKNTLKWKLGAYNLPTVYDENSQHKRIKEFKELAGNSGKLAYLKLDVDNLGKLFINGITIPSLSRMSVLSRFLRMFFEGYLPNYIKYLNFENDIYIVFSGGDDTFLIGNVETIITFAKKLRKKFNDFVCGNQTITFSAGIGIFRYNFPITRATQITEKYLESAKELIYPDENEPTKDKITILGEVFTWNEYDYIIELYNVIKSIVADDEKNSRGIIQKIINSTKGWKPLLDSAQNGKLNSKRIWRLRYFLREAAKDTKERIIEIYEKMWFKNLYIDSSKKEHEIKNHQIITVAAKLADLQTRD